MNLSVGVVSIIQEECVAEKGSRLSHIVEDLTLYDPHNPFIKWECPDNRS